MVRKRSGLSLKVLIFTITAAWTQWSGMQNSVVVPLYMELREILYQRGRVVTMFLHKVSQFSLFVLD